VFIWVQKVGSIILPNAAEAFDYQIDRSLRVDIQYDPDLGLSDSLERRIAAVAGLKGMPDIICGQRSSLIQLPEPSTLFNGFGLEAIQVKGHFFRPTEESRVIHNPQMTIYTGRGHPDAVWNFDNKGNLSLDPNPDVPSGAMLLKDAKLEFGAAKEMIEAGLPVVCPMGFGRFPDLEFNIARAIAEDPNSISEFALINGVYFDPKTILKNYKVGFMVYGIYTLDNRRCFESVLDIASGLDKENKKAFLTDFFRTYGAALRQFHDAGYIHGSPNLDNLSLVPVSNTRREMNLPNRLQTFSAYEIVFHDLTGDLGTVTRKRDVTKEKWLSHVIWDLGCTTGLLANFYYTENEWNELYRQAPSNRISIIRRNHEVAKLTQETSYNPAPDFFKGYLGAEYHKIPSNYFNRTGREIKPCDIRTVIDIPLQMSILSKGTQVNIPRVCNTESLMKVVKDVYL
jgi:hypothetical protein